MAQRRSSRELPKKKIQIMAGVTPPLPTAAVPTQLRVGKQKNYIILLLFGWRITLCQTLRSLCDSHYPSESFSELESELGKSRQWVLHKFWLHLLAYFGKVTARISSSLVTDKENYFHIHMQLASAL